MRERISVMIESGCAVVHISDVSQSSAVESYHKHSRLQKPLTSHLPPLTFDIKYI